MVQQSFYDERIQKAVKASYEKLCEYCEKLVEHGYWEKPSEVIGMPIEWVLDSYLQAVLIEISTRIRGFGNSECDFILNLTKENPYELKVGEPIGERVARSVKKMMQSPPIILQLCGLMDAELNTKSSCVVLDCFINILMAMIYINYGKSSETLKPIEDYYLRVSVFLDYKDIEHICNPKYLFYKFSFDRIDTSFMEELLIKDRVVEQRKIQQERILRLKHEMEDETGVILDENSRQKKENDLVKQGKEEEITNSSVAKNDEPQEEIMVSKLDEYIEELNSLIGLKEVKEEVNSLINLIRVNNMRKQHNMPATEMSYHMVFTGNPGTGKTTVARLIAQIYKELGILSEGNLVETDRSGLVAGYVGQTALKVKEVVEEAIGGILFIDEAYSLATQTGGNDFGSEAIDTLVKLMEDHRNNLVVIVAGYGKEMDQFLHSNPGLISRFNKFIEFNDYSSEELIDILTYLAKSSEIVVTTDAKEDLKNQIDAMTDLQRKSFGNARGIRNVFEKVLVNQANRIVLYKEPTSEQLRTIEIGDVCGVVVAK